MVPTAKPRKCWAGTTQSSRTATMMPRDAPPTARISSTAERSRSVRSMPSDSHQLVDHLLRHQAGQMVEWLTRIFGPAHLELAEEVVQDALVKALQQWPFSGIPENPAGWLFAVARNRAL